jgi:chromosome segregation protein
MFPRGDSLFLRSLTIKGFKSFARKTVLEFEPGVTIIVGPNGSGKSNIADAVMWVLGEQSPTSLRGNRMEDIIFAGSNSLKPVNLAEVTLTLDNSNNDFPLDYAEVTISRNVVRGGDSEYRLNNSACRLLDIQELLSDAGVGRTLNSVISQGQLDDVLSCRPEERRDYIEEAGGLLKYRKRREKAMRQLARMDEEMVRTHDVAREVRRQLRPLQRQAGRLEQYTTLIRELNEAKLRLDVARLRSMRRQWQEHQEKQEERSRRLEALDTEIAEKAASALSLEKMQAEWRINEASIRNGLYRLVSLHEQLKAMLSLWDERSRRSKEEESLLPAPDPAALAGLTADNVQLEAARTAATDRQESLLAREAEQGLRAVELNRRLNDLARQRATIEARLEVLSASLRLEPGSIQEKLLARRAELEALRAEREALEAGLASAEEELAGSRARLDELEQRAEELHAERVKALAELREREGVQAGLAATLDILTRLDTETWGPANASSALLEDDPTDGGLGGMLVTSLKIDPHYETAISGYLGPWLYGMVARDMNAIILAIEHLKSRGLGQALFFRHSGSEPAPARTEPMVEGAVRARDAVSSPEWFDDALDALLDGVYLAQDLDVAVELAGRHPHLVFLTPDGDVITGGTMIKGGSQSVNPATLEMNAGRREKLEESLAQARERIDALELLEKGLAAEIGDVRGELTGAREAHAAARDRVDEARSRAASLQAVTESMGAELENWTGEAPSEQDAPVADQGDLAARAAEMKAEEGRVSAELAECEEARRALAEELREAASALAAIERRLEIGRIKEQDLRSRKPAVPAGDVEAAIAEADLDRLVSLHERLAGQLESARERARRGLDDGVLKEKEASEGLRLLREKMSALQEDHERLRDQIHDEELARAELKVRVEQLVDRVVDEHKVPLDFALKHHADEEPTPELESKVEELSRELEHIGPVNPEAITEREALEQRFDFLKTQMDDIELARGQLKRVVKQVDREIEEKFSETLGAVNYHFKTIFSTLFKNGSAELRLTDPDDVLNSGVEIMAQPEGKRLRRISLLSGGETSMTALAFFFALFKVRPSPFYFLDEVEAALDDVNLHRFLDLVRDFKGESQLVLITHQKRSMEIADILYGVTMQDDGMSRVISQKVTEKVEERAAS